MNKITRFEHTHALLKAAAELLINLSQSAIKKQGRFTIALSGGNTPQSLYSLLAADTYSKRIDWKNWYIFWSDERYLPADDPENNSYMAKKKLLDHVPIPSENVFPIPVKLSPDEAATNYEQTLKIIFKSSDAAFDLIMLGLGNDGHTASLFPNSSILEEKNAWVKAVFVEAAAMHRISFTVPFINQAKQILFLVTGKQKAAILQKVLEGKKDTTLYPAQMIKVQKNSVLYWYIDKGAGANLKSNLQ